MKKNKNLPNFIIAGAPRCGTTALYSYLSDHPDVFTPERKELCYFIDEGFFTKKYLQYSFPKFYNSNIETYTKYFEKYNGEKIVMESSPDYLYQNLGVEEMGKILPSSTKYIILLRNPVDRIYSFFKFSKNNRGRIPKNINFSQFISKVENGDYAEYPNLHNIINYSKYINYIDSFITNSKSENVYIYLFEDLISNPLKFLINFCQEQGIDSSFYETYTFEKKNDSFFAKNTLLAKVYSKIPLPNKIRYSDFKIKTFLKSLYYKLNIDKTKEEKTTEDVQTIKKIKKTFIASNTLLAEKYKIDIPKFWT